MLVSNGGTNPYLRHPSFKNSTVNKSGALYWLETVEFLNKRCLKYGVVSLFDTNLVYA